MSAKNLLYVEDDPENQELIRLFLHNEPYDITTAEDPAEALEKLISRHFDIIIVDLNLQNDGDGAELIRDIREMPRYETVPIIVFSGSDERHFSQFDIQDDVQQFFQKPTGKKRLIDAIRDFDNTEENHK